MTVGQQVIECLCCGSALTQPAGLKERAGFACPVCTTVLHNVPFVREFRWDAQDPYLRAHGATRGNLWGGAAGALVWLVVLGLLMLVRGRFSLGVFTAIALPYLLLLVSLRLLRPRRPAMLWMMFMWMGLGAYCLYLAALQMLLKDWSDVMKAVAVVSPALLLSLGCAWLVTGFVGVWLHRAYARRLPQALLAAARPAAPTTVAASVPPAVPPTSAPRA